MKAQIATVEDDFWTERLPFFTAQFPTYYRKPQQLHGRFHTSEEKYEASRYEIIPISERKGKRTYVMMQPYVVEPNLTLTIGLYNKPKHYADQDSPIGETIGAPQVQGFRDINPHKARHVNHKNSCLPALADTGSMAPDNCTGLRSPGRDDPRSAPVSVDQGSIGLSRPGTG
jgi:hypothetical protein